jgi:hypothetical protein
VFVSSTLGELADERRAVSRAISGLRLTPVMFELGARPHPPRELYRAYLAQSDIFIGLYWQRYGQVVPGMELSGLEDEFERSRGLPRLLYVKRPHPIVSRVSRTCSHTSGRRPPTALSARRVSCVGSCGMTLATLLSERFAAARSAAIAGAWWPTPAAGVLDVAVRARAGDR